MSSQTTPLNAPAANKPPFSSTKNTLNGRPLWQWWVIGGGASLALIALVLYLIRPSTPGLDLIVTEAPQGSDVYVDGVKRGIPMPDGRIRIPNLKEGTHQVRFSAQEKDNQRVDLTKSGQEYKYLPNTPSVVVELPSPITYEGSEMVLVKGGPFPMGDNPSRNVDVPAFYMDKFEITNGMFKIFCAPRNACPKFADDPGYFERDTQSPVIAISYDEAAAYAASVNKAIPTEEQLEKAATWGPGWEIGRQTKRKWPWGDTPIQGVNLVVHASERVPRPVGTSPGDKSAYDVMDIAGNAPEWVDGALNGFHIVRGGQWFDGTFDYAQSVKRRPEPRSNPQFANKEKWAVGFRCVVPVSDPGIQAFLRQKGFIN